MTDAVTPFTLCTPIHREFAHLSSLSYVAHRESKASQQLGTWCVCGCVCVCVCVCVYVHTKGPFLLMEYVSVVYLFFLKF